MHAAASDCRHQIIKPSSAGSYGRRVVLKELNAATGY